MTSPGPALRSVTQQAIMLRRRFSGAAVDLMQNRLTWIGDIQPTALSRTYTVCIVYEMWRYPTVRVITPKLEPRSGESLPHVFSDGSLCLHVEADWKSDMRIVDTTIPWTSEWLAYYEIWKFTGEWYGGGQWPPRRRLEAAKVSSASRRGVAGAR